ncbi:MAG TPA: competence type IV pilus minor pilin ComGD [Virgibacillus sp.]|nr:competence type IV pilus minor pilin ComGD [Virgibacillus sp.]
MEKSLSVPEVKKLSGFTLIEMLIALSVIAILLLLYVPIQHSTILNLEEKKFFEQLDYDLQLLQNKSLGSTKTWALQFENNGYHILTLKEKPLIKRELPENWRINYRVSKTIHYSSTGTFKDPGTISIHTTKNNYRLVFPFGKSRYRLEEL